MGIVISPMTAQAGEITDSVNGVISFEEYYTTLRSEYKKRGVDFTIINPDTTKTYTEKQLEKEISQICEEPVREATAQNNAAELLKSLSPQSVARTPMPIKKLTIPIKLYHLTINRAVMPPSVWRQVR